MPATGPEAARSGTRASLRKAHAIRKRRTLVPDAVDYRNLLTMYKQNRPAPDYDREDRLTNEGLYAHLIFTLNFGRIRNDGMSGFPEISLYPKKGKEMAEIHTLWWRFKYAMDQAKAVVSERTPNETVGLSHFDINNINNPPALVFVKNEPHSQEKATQGRFRTIQAVSMIKLFWSLLFTEPLKRQTDFWQHTNSTIGCNMADQAGRQEIYNLMPKGPKLSSDCSCFEFTVTKEDWMGFLLVCGYLAGVIEIEDIKDGMDVFQFLSTHRDETVRLSLYYAQCVTNPYVVFGDGVQVMLKDHDGSPLLWRNPSGHPATSMVSQCARQLQELVNNRESPHPQDNFWMLCNGDDCVSNVHPEKYEENNTRQGKAVTDVRCDSQTVEYIGILFSSDGDHKYQRVDKAIASYLHSEKNDEQRNALRAVVGNEIADPILMF